MEGYGQEIDLSNIVFLEEFNFKGFTDEMRLLTFILAGCDYLKSLKGIGFMTAYRIVSEAKTLRKVCE